MYYCLSYHPQLSPELAKAIEAIRNDYDPTAPYYAPHITMIFPTHHGVGEKPLIEQISHVLAGWRPFEIRLGGLHLTRDFWLFLQIQEGEEKVKKLYRELHSGILDDGRDYDRYIPHIGLGLFVKKGRPHDWRNPRESDFDRESYEEALRKAETLPLGERILLDKLLLITVSDTVIDWTRGRRADLPEDAYETTVRVFVLS